MVERGTGAVLLEVVERAVDLNIVVPEVVERGAVLPEVVERAVGLNEVVTVVERVVGGLYLKIPKHFTTKLGSPLNSSSAPGIGLISM